MTLQTCAPENFRLCRWGDERTVKRAQMVSEDPHRRERKFVYACVSFQTICPKKMNLFCMNKVNVNLSEEY